MQDDEEVNVDELLDHVSSPSIIVHIVRLPLVFQISTFV
jgi:hypothetical protein